MMMLGGQSFISSVFAVVCSEVGDNTFFVAVILAMGSSKIAVFTGALLANALMHALSVLLGYVASIIPRDIVLFSSTLLLAIYGLKMLWDGYQMLPDKTEREYKEAEKDIEKHEKKQLEKFGSGFVRRTMSTALFKAFSLTLLCEWGDRSQVSTILMTTHGGAASAVLIGGIVGHALCLLLATVGGSYISRLVSVRAMTICGGFTFLILAMSSLLESTSRLDD